MSADTSQLSEERILFSIFRDGHESVQFSEAFLSDVSHQEISALRTLMIDELGRIKSIKRERHGYSLIFEKGTAGAFIELGDYGRVEGLRIFYVAKSGDSIEGVFDTFKSLPGETSYTVIRNGEVAFSHRNDRRMSVGSSFKIYIFSALERAIERGEVSWTMQLELNSRHKSLPSGLLQDWPDGAVLTVDTAAILMISLSDNTATDLLIDSLGREWLAFLSPLDPPLLKTREYFLLNDPSRSDLKERYISSATDERVRLLEFLLDVSDLPRAEMLGQHLPEMEIGWHTTTKDLAFAITNIQRKDIFSILPPPFPADPWVSTMYKGGSGQGVLNATICLEHANGATYSLSMTQNDPHRNLDQRKFFEIVAQVVQALAVLESLLEE